MQKKSMLKGLSLGVKFGERVLLKKGDTEIWVGVNSDTRKRIKLIVDAPKDVIIVREEILARKESV